MNLAQSLLHALRDHGAREIFGIPGDFALPFFGVVEQSKILPLYTLSHEPAVGFAADAAARYRCGLSVAAVTYGAGALNMVNATAAAFAEKSPVVVVSAGPGIGEASSGLLLHHQAKSLDSQYQIYAEITCDRARLDDVDRAPAQIARVLRSCLTFSQPVYLEIPRDMVGAACRPVSPAPVPAFDADALSACVDEILARLREAASAVLMVGVEVRRYGARAEGGRARAPARPAGGHELHGARPAGGRGCAAGRDLPGRGRRARGHAHGRGLRCAVPARRDPVRHQLRRVPPQDRPAPHHPGPRPARGRWAITCTRRFRSTRWSMRCSRACLRRAGGSTSRDPSIRAVSRPTARRSRRRTSPAPSTI